METKKINITHVVNPHRFWFIHEGSSEKNAQDIECALEKYVMENGDRIKISDSEKCRSESCVGVFLQSKQKWIRAQIDSVDEECLENNEVLVWAIDYGYPIKTTIDLVVILSTGLKNRCITTSTNVIQGGIYGIMPASQKMDVSYFIFLN